MNANDSKILIIMILTNKSKLQMLLLNLTTDKNIRKN